MELGFRFRALRALCLGFGMEGLGAGGPGLRGLVSHAHVKAYG